MGIIYLLTNKINGKQYVGQTIRELEVRIHQYEKDARYVPKKRSAIIMAVRKYGLDCFGISVLKECTNNELDKYERKYIKDLNTISPNGYNLESGGSINKIVSKETRLKMAKARIGKIMTPEHRKAISESQTGRKFTDEERKKVSIGLKKRFESKEAHEKLSISAKKRYENQEARDKTSLATKKVWEREGYKERLKIAIKDGCKNAWTPEMRLKHSLIKRGLLPKGATIEQLVSAQ